MSGQVFVAESGFNVVHAEESFSASRPGAHRISATRCGKELDFDGGEVAGRIFSLGLAHLEHEACEECRLVNSAESKQLAMAGT